MLKLKEKRIIMESKEEKLASKNAFRVSKKTKSIETQDEYDYYEEAPIIIIKFKRDTSSFLQPKQKNQSILIRKLLK